MIYCRISDDREGRELGVQRQEEDCRALAARLGVPVAAVLIDNDVSASTLSKKPRPAYDRLMAAMERREAGTIIAYSNSRLTRRPLELEALIKLYERHGTQIATVVSGQDDLSTADGRMVARIKASVDAAEAERAAERVQRSKRQAAANGWYRGGRRPFGYEADGVTVRESEADMIRRATRDVLAGRSLRAVAHEWRSVFGEADGAYEGKRVKRILLRPRNAGLIDVRGEVVGKAVWPAIITEDEHRALVAVLTNPARRTTPGPEPKHLLSGIATCAVCDDGTTLIIKSNRGMPTYTCRRAPHVARLQSTLDPAVTAVIKALINDPLVVDGLRPAEHADNSQVDRDRADALRARLAAAEADYAEGLINGRQLNDVTQRVEAELGQIAQRETARFSDSLMADLLAAPDPAAAFDAATIDRKRAIVSDLLTVRVGAAGNKVRPEGWRFGVPYSNLLGVSITRRKVL